MISQGNTTQSLHQLLLASGLMADAVCLNQGGSWCFPKVMETDLSALSIAARSTATPSKTTLDAACTPCLISYVRAYMRVTQAMAATDSGPATSAIQKQASSFELLCTKDLAGHASAAWVFPPIICIKPLTISTGRLEHVARNRIRVYLIATCFLLAVFKKLAYVEAAT